MSVSYSSPEVKFDRCQAGVNSILGLSMIKVNVTVVILMSVLVMQ